MQHRRAARIINVFVGDHRYQVNLDTEQVKRHLVRRWAWRWVRVTSQRIINAAILRASDAWHRGETVAPQIDVPQDSKDLLQALCALRDGTQDQADTPAHVALQALAESYGINEQEHADGRWTIQASPLADVNVTITVTPSGSLSAEVSAEYCGRQMHTTTAEGGPAIAQAIEQARCGLQRGRVLLQELVRGNDHTLQHEVAFATVRRGFSSPA